MICLGSITSIHLSPFNADQSAYVVYGSPICYIMWWRKTRGVAHTAPWEREEGDCLDRWTTSMVWLKELAVAGGRGPNERKKGRKNQMKLRRSLGMQCGGRGGGGRVDPIPQHCCVSKRRRHPARRLLSIRLLFCLSTFSSPLPHPNPRRHARRGKDRKNEAKARENCPRDERERGPKEGEGCR